MLLDEPGDLPPEERAPCPRCKSKSRHFTRTVGEWVREPLVFLSLPRDVEFEAVRQRVTHALAEGGMRIADPGSETGAGDSWPQTYLRKLEAADAVIVDVTGRSPNVLYELGYANALRKPVLPLVRTGEGSRVVGDVHGILYFPYDPDQLEELTAVVRSWAARHVGMPPAESVPA
jgi:hypothetical protein